VTLSFSISVPIGAWHPFLPACLASLACQKAALNVALLDASGDPRVAEIAHKYDKVLHYRRHGPDGGQSAAILEGWANAPGDILGWLNADDILMPDALETALAKFQTDPSLDMVYGHSTILDENARMVGYHWAVEPPGEALESQRIYEAGVISQPSCFFKREKYKAAGGLDEALHYTMDWDLWIRLYKAGAKTAFIDKPLSMVLWGGETKTSSFNAQRRQELKRIIEVYTPQEKQRKVFRAFALHNLMNRIRPAALKTVITRALHRGRKKIYGLSADGEVSADAQLHLTHYDREPRKGVSVSFEKPPHGMVISADAAIAGQRITGNCVDVDFQKPMESGRVTVLALERSAGARLYFQHVEWR